MQILLRDLAPGQQYAIAFRSNDGHGGTSDWSQVTRFTTTSDTMPPANVANLSLFTQDASYFATWDKVTTNNDGTPLLDFASYHVHVASTGGSGTGDFYPLTEHFEFTKAQNLATFGTFQTALTFTVRAVDKTHNESLIPATLTYDPAIPAQPSAPVVTNYIGLLQVTWDTLNSVGGGMPSNFVYCEVHVSTTSGFTPTTSTLVGTITSSSPKYVIAGLTYGTTYYVRLIAVNALSKKSNPSGQASGSPQRITGLDIQNGQISAEQINWVATGIPGGNAYYSTTAPTGGTYTTNDIWYDTGNAYTPHHWTGSAWGGPATDVGFIVGTKILAGTLTANAIGANQIITASANIANAVIDDAHISNVSAAKLTAGTVSADVVLAGRFATALTGARCEMNSSGFQKFASDGVTKLVDINGTGTALLTGQYQSDVSGNRRIVIGAPSGIGEILFQAATGEPGETGYILGFAQSTSSYMVFGTTTAALGSSVGSGNTLWNSVTYNNHGYATYYANTHDFSFNSTASSTAFIVREDYGNGTATTTLGRLQLDGSGLFYWDTHSRGGNGRFMIDSNGIRMWDHNSQLSFSVDDTNSGNVLIYGNGPYKPGATTTTGSFVRFASPTDINVGGLIQMFTAPIGGASYGGMIFWAMDSGITNPRFELLDWSDVTFYPVWASAFTVSSDAAGKEEIQDFTGSALDIVNGLRVREYYRKPGPQFQRGKKEIGLVAQEAHPLLVETTERGQGVELYRLSTMNTKSIQELHSHIKTLETRIAQLEGKK